MNLSFFNLNLDSKPGQKIIIQNHLSPNLILQKNNNNDDNNKNKKLPMMESDEDNNL